MEGDKFAQAGKLLIGQQTDDKTEEKDFKDHLQKVFSSSSPFNPSINNGLGTAARLIAHKSAPCMDHIHWIKMVKVQLIFLGTSH